MFIHCSHRGFCGSTYHYTGHYFWNCQATSCTAWNSIQLDCTDIRRTHAHLTLGTRPSLKLFNIRDIKRYLIVATIAKDGLLVVKRTDALASPRQVLDRLIMALHIKLNHPTAHQLKTIFHRFLYALDMDRAIDQGIHTCHQCATLMSAPHTLSP